MSMKKFVWKSPALVTAVFALFTFAAFSNTNENAANLIKVPAGDQSVSLDTAAEGSPQILLSDETSRMIDPDYLHPMDDPFTIVAQVRSLHAVFIDSVKLFWRQLGQTRYFETGMFETSPDIWQATIPDSAVRYQQIQFYIWAADDSSTNTAPARPLENPFSINVSAVIPDTRPTFLQLTDSTYALTAYHHPSNRALEISAYFVDDLARSADRVILSHRLLGESFYKQVSMRVHNDNVWSAHIGSNDVLPDGMQFFITAFYGNESVNAPSTMDEQTDNPYFISVVHVNKGPTINRTPSTIALGTLPQQRHQPIEIQAFIVDDVLPGLQSARLFFKHESDVNYKSVEMTNVFDSLYAARMHPDHVYPERVLYFVTATDSKIDTYDPADVLTDGEPYEISIDTTLYNEPPVIHLTPETQALGITPQRYGYALRIEATIIDTVGHPLIDANLHYRACGGLSFTTVSMMNDMNSLWWGEIPADVVMDPCVEYYISARDKKDTGYNPEGLSPQEAPHVINVMPPNPPPEIVHTPITYHPPDSSMHIQAAVYDSTNVVDSVFVYYRNQESNLVFKKLRMARYEADQYEAFIPSIDVIKPSIEYYIWAVDDAGNDARTQVFEVSTFLTPSTFAIYPNPFTPNNDGYNDYVLFDIDELRQGRGSVVFYNQRGRKVYELVNDDKWYGVDDNGASLPPGIYLFAISIDGQIRFSDTLTLIR